MSVLPGPIRPVCGTHSKVAGSRGAHEVVIVLLQVRDGGELIGCKCVKAWASSLQRLSVSQGTATVEGRCNAAVSQLSKWSVG